MALPSSPGSQVFADGFDSVGLGTFDDDELDSTWNNPPWENGIDEGRAAVVQTGRGQALEVLYPKGEIGSGGSGVQWQTKFPGQEAAHLTFWVRFDEDFAFVRGGKLGGLAGGKANTGGKKPDGTDGWSGRVTWREDGCGAFYVYHPDMPGGSGEHLNWAAGFKRGVWHRIDQVVVMNTPGENDGALLGWLDGRLVVERRDFRFRTLDTFSADVLYFSTFFGGGLDSYRPPSDQQIQFDDYVVRSISADKVRR